jgi:hypothetical protein
MNHNRKGSAMPKIEHASEDLKPPPFAFSSRFNLICTAILVFSITVAGVCGGNTISCFSVIFLDGIIAFAWVAGATAIGWLALRPFKLQCSPSLAIATAGGLGLGIFSLLGLGLGLLGWLNRPVAIAFPVVSVALFAIDLLGHHSAQKQLDIGPIKQWLREPAGAAWLWLIPVVSLAIAAVSASLMPGILWKPLDPHPYDVTSYHLLVPREWYECGRIVPLAHNVFSYFPFNVEIQFLLLMHATGGPWAGMYACQFVCVGYTGLMVLGVFGARGEGKSSTFAPLTAAAIVSTVPWVIMLAGVAYVESALLLYTTLAIAWALHAISNPNNFTRSAVLAGILAGLACGVKIIAVPMLLLAMPVGLLTVLWIRRPAELSQRKILRGCITLGIAGSIVLSPWLIRNFIWCGNPVFPVAMKLVGHDHFSNLQVVRFYTEHSPTFSQKPLHIRFTILFRDVLTHWQYGFVLLPAGVIACGLGWASRQSWLLVICGLFVLVVWIGFTHTIPRFAVMIIPVAALAVGRMQWSQIWGGRAWPVALILLLAATICSWSFVMPELTSQIARAPFFGPVDMRGIIESTELSDALQQNPHLQVAMIGDAQAFLYPIPLSQLHYRTVFNVATGYDNPVDAWIGPQVRGNHNWLLVINPMEIDRLHRTYVGVPPLPREWEPYLDAQKTVFLHGDQLP